MRLRTIAVAAATGLVVALAPATAHAAKPTYKVTISLSKKTADVGQKIAVSGKVSGPRSAKKKLLVQRKVGSGAWKTVTKVTTTKQSRYATKVTVRTAGKQALRVVAPASSKRAKGVSKARSYTGYRWLDLTKQSRDNSDLVVTGPVTLAGKTYAKAFSFNVSGTFFKVAKACTTLRLGLGAADEATDTVFDLYRLTTPGLTESADRVRTAITPGAAPQTRSYRISGFPYIAFGSGGTGPIATVNPTARCSVNRLPTMPDVAI